MEANNTYTNSWYLPYEVHQVITSYYTTLLGPILAVVLFFVLSVTIGPRSSSASISSVDDKLEPIPGPKPLPIVGNALILDINDLVGSILAIAYRYRPIFSLTLLGKRETFVSSPALCRELCDERRFHKLVTKGLERLRPVTGDGLFTAYHDSHAWGIAHRVLLPLFGTFRIRDMFDDMKDIAEQLCLKWLCFGVYRARMEPWTKLDLGKEFTRLTLDTVALTCLDHRFNSFYRSSSLPTFVQQIDFVLAEAATTATLPDWCIPLRYSQRKQWAKSVAYINKACQAMIDERRAAGEQKSRKDVLSAMVFGRDPETGKGLTDEEIIHNMLTFLSAGHETTSATLAVVCYYLCEHPEKLQKARAEVDSVVGANGLSVQHIQRLPYLDAVLRETLRLVPTAPAFFVTPKQDEIVGGKYLVKKGESLCVALEVLQRDPDVYGEDADQFRPERMLQSEGADKLDDYAWKPFGNGLRGCIGRTFVWQESLIILALILQNFEIRKDDPNYKLKLRSDLSVKLDGFYMQARLRHGLTPAELRRRLAGSGEKDVSISNVAKGASSYIPKSLEPHISGQPITILHGSNTGTCEALATFLATGAVARGFAPHVVGTMNSAARNLSVEGCVIMIVASYNGLPADNTAKMIEWLQEAASTTGSLRHVKYAVFGCGHKDWRDTYQKVPRLVEELMDQAGATSVAPVGEADAATSDMYSDLERWSLDFLFPALYKTHNMRAPQSTSDQTLMPADDRVSVLTSSPLRVLNLHTKGYELTTVTDTYRLSSPSGKVPIKRHVELKLAGDVRYTPGDHIHILPRNDPSLVERVLACFALEADTQLSIQSGQALGIHEGIELTAAELFGAWVELNHPVTTKNVQKLLGSLTENESGVKADVEKFVRSGEGNASVSVVQLLEHFPRLFASLASFLRILTPMRPRAYSISSSAAVKPGHCTLTVSVVPEGTASGYLSKVRPGQVLYTRLQENPRFLQQPRERKDISLIMICVGSGLAPFRSLIQEAMADPSTPGKGKPEWHLFYGCRGRELDELYSGELRAAEKAGVVVIHRAYSWDSSEESFKVPSRYVTDAIKRQATGIADLWKKGALVRVCAGKGIADAVWDINGPALFEVEAAQDPTVRANGLSAWRQELARQGKYVEEIFN